MSIAIHNRREGFILAEALIALLLLGVALIALERLLTVALRSLADSEREFVATGMAESQRERAFSLACTSAAGVDSSNGVVVSWTAVPAAGATRLIQTSRYTSRFGERGQQYDAVGMCR
jgi:Tfp pilus assembly protein PilV